MSKRRKCRRSFLFSRTALAVVSKTASALTWATSHLQSRAASITVISIGGNARNSRFYPARGVIRPLA
jgi:hypothetical protein